MFSLNVDVSEKSCVCLHSMAEIFGPGSFMTLAVSDSPKKSVFSKGLLRRTRSVQAKGSSRETTDQDSIRSDESKSDKKPASQPPLKLLDILKTKDKSVVTAFRAFLLQEYSAENIEFWLACQRFKSQKIRKSEDRKVAALEIYEKYLADGAPNEVNLPSESKERLVEALGREVDAHLFDIVQQEILNLMQSDTFPRFLKSDLYRAVAE